MSRIKNGDLVARKSYNKDVIFIVKSTKNKKNILLEGVFERIIADSKIEDLELIDRKELSIREEVRKTELKKIENRLEENKSEITGKVLHLDGE